MCVCARRYVRPLQCSYIRAHQHAAPSGRRSNVNGKRSEYTALSAFPRVRARARACVKNLSPKLLAPAHSNLSAPFNALVFRFGRGIIGYYLMNSFQSHLVARPLFLLGFRVAAAAATALWATFNDRSARFQFVRFRGRMLGRTSKRGKSGQG